MTTNAWSLTGTYFESCNCDTACPCVFLTPPTEDECTVLVGWHIDRGNVDELRLDGRNVALAVKSPGHMATEPRPWRCTSTTGRTVGSPDALTRIFTGQEGGHPKRLAGHIGEAKEASR